MAEIELKLRELHPAQLQVLEEAKRFNVLDCGRRWGKTDFLIDQVVEDLVNGGPIAWFSPTYKMATPVWRQLKSVLGRLIKHKDETERFIETHTGGTIDFWSILSGAADSARGRKYKKVYIDEAGRIPSTEPWNEVIRPTLTDMVGGAWISGTPKGRGTWFWQMFIVGQDPNHPEQKSWQMPTSANPYILQSEIDAAERALPALSFQQEYLAEWIDDGGVVFRGVDRQAIIPVLFDTPYLMASRPYSGYFSMGIDWGLINDYTTITVFDGVRGRVVAVDRFNQIDYQFQLARLRTMFEVWRPATILAEQNAMGLPLIQQLQGEGWPIQGFNTTGSSKPVLIQALALAIEKGDLWLLNDNYLKSELKSYGIEILKNGRFIYGPPEGLHDDFVISLALAWWAVNLGQITIDGSVPKVVIDKRLEKVANYRGV